VKMQRSFVSMVLLSALVSFRPCPAAAGDKEQAKRLFDSGVKLMQLEDFGAATADLERSVALYPTQNSLFNLANCYKGLQRYADALGVLARLRRDFGDKLKPEIKAAAERHEREIQALVARLTIKTAPDDASVNLDGRDLGAGPVLGPLVLAPGDHRLEATRVGHRSVQRSVRLVSGESRTEVLHLVPERGSVVLRADVPGATVLVDGEEAGKTPLASAISLPPGSHVITVRAVGRQQAERTIEIRPGEAQVLDITLVPFEAAKPANVSSADKTAQPGVDVASSTSEAAKENPRARFWRVVAWSSAAVAVASGVAALVFWKVLGDGRMDDAKKDDANYHTTGNLDAQNESHAAFAGAQRDGHIATGFGIGAGVLAIAAVGAFWAQASQPDAPTAQTRVSVSPFGFNVRF
jgi:PEGA domain.